MPLVYLLAIDTYNRITMLIQSTRLRRESNAGL